MQLAKINAMFSGTIHMPFWCCCLENHFPKEAHLQMVWWCHEQMPLIGIDVQWNFSAFKSDSIYIKQDNMCLQNVDPPWRHVNHRLQPALFTHSRMEPVTFLSCQWQEVFSVFPCLFIYFCNEWIPNYRNSRFAQWTF